MAKKAAVMIYPQFSMQEISCLTDALKVYFDIEIDVFASKKEIICSEDSFQVIPHKTFNEFRPEDYLCLILPGIYNPLPALFDEENIRFLRALKGSDLLICSISCSPILLAKAGLLDDVHYTSGMWQEMAEYLPFVPHQNFIHQPLVKDKNILTAMGFAYREFAVETIRTLGIDACEKGLFNPVTRSYTEEELTFYMGKENFAEFLEEYESYLTQKGER